MTDAAERKRELRRRLRSVLGVLPPETRRLASGQAVRRLQDQVCWQQASAVLFYAPLPEEVDLGDAAEAALAGGKVVAVLRFEPGRGRYLPRRVGDWSADLAPGHRGVPEPRERCPSVEMNRLDFVLVPGLGFTPDGRRLGRGKGCYDRILAQVRGLKCGVAFDQQVVDEIPVEPHDVAMDCILTPTRWCWVTRRAVPN